MSLAVGSRLGPYEIIAPAGAGGMGEVYRARDPRLGREVAIKVLPAAFANDASRLRRFEQEARAAAALNHPNILALHDIGTYQPTTIAGTAAVAAAQDHPYIVSELLEGNTLRERLRPGPLPMRKAVDYALQLSRGLAAAHDKGIVHRDLKPENIFITDDGRVKILDFGLAKLTRPEIESWQAFTHTADSEAGAVLGTVGYMSPEQVRGKLADTRSDLFSFGAILYEMVSGKRAFHGESAAETMSAILKEEPPDLTETNRTVPAALERVVRHCLEKNPAERFQSARDVAFDLETITSGSSASAAQPAVPTAKLKRVKWIAVAAAVLLAFGVGAVLGRRTAPTATVPSYEQLTFRRGTVSAAKFAGNGQIVYSAAWEGKPPEVFVASVGGRGASGTGVQDADVQAVSRAGDALLVMGRQVAYANVRPGTLARMPLTGAAPRPLLENVQDADWAPDGNNIAVSHYVKQRFRLEFPIGKVLYETSGYISSPRVSPKGDMVAFLDHPTFGDDMGTVAVVDLEGHKRTLSQQFPSLQTLQWAPSGDELWFSGSLSGVTANLYAVTLGGKMRSVATAPGGLRLFDIAPDGRAIVAQGRLRISTIALAPAQQEERDLTVADWSVPVDISKDGSTVLIDEESESTTGQYSPYLRKTDGSAPVKLADGFYALNLSPDGQWVLTGTQDAPAQLVLLPTGPGGPQQLTHDNIDHRAGVFMPDGSAVVFDGAEPGMRPRIYIQSVTGGAPRPLTPEGVSGVPRVSPDSKRISVSGEQTWIVPVGGGPTKAVPGTTRGQFAAAWSTDGRGLYVSRRTQTTGAALYRVDPESGKEEEVRRFAPADPAGITGVGPIRVTPDLKAYAYGVSRNLNELYLVTGLK